VHQIQQKIKIKRQPKPPQCTVPRKSLRHRIHMGPQRSPKMIRKIQSGSHSSQGSQAKFPLNPKSTQLSVRRPAPAPVRMVPRGHKINKGDSHGPQSPQCPQLPHSIHRACKIHRACNMYKCPQYTQGFAICTKVRNLHRGSQSSKSSTSSKQGSQYMKYSKESPTQLGVRRPARHRRHGRLEVTRYTG
jgi:hypothetical protein